jgi:hypothetical protein
MSLTYRKIKTSVRIRCIVWVIEHAVRITTVTEIVLSEG